MYKEIGMIYVYINGRRFYLSVLRFYSNAALFIHIGQH